MLLTLFISFFLFVDSANSGVITSKENENAKRDITEAYKYSHLPAAEYFSVPVVVLYEEGNRKEKSVKIKQNDSTNSQVKSPESEVTTVESSDNLKEIQEITTISTLNNNRDINIMESSITPVDSDSKSLREDKKEETKPLNYQNGLIIPVSVVYDVEPIKAQRHIKSRLIRKSKTVNRQQRNKNTEIEAGDQNKKEDNISNTLKEVPVNANIRTFPKRTQTKRDPVIPILQSENYVFSHSGDFHYRYCVAQ